MLTQVVLPKPVISLRPSMVGEAVVTIGVPSEVAPPQIGRVDLGGAAHQHRRQVDGEGALAVGAGQQEVGVRGRRGLAAERACEPPTVALFERVRLWVELLTAVIVVPAGMPRPVMTSPAARPDVLVMPVTAVELAVSVPVKRKV